MKNQKVIQMVVGRIVVETSRKTLRGPLIGGLCLVALLISSADTADAQVRYASEKRSNAATAHYARARAMCVETLEEFEVGRKYARPDLLLDPDEWRLTLISLCEQLNRLIDPKIRVSNAGIQVNANPSLISRAKDNLPEVADGPKSRNDFGEAERMKEKQDARARMYAPLQNESVIEAGEHPVYDDEMLSTQDEALEQEFSKEEEEQLTDEELIEQAIQDAIDAERGDTQAATEQVEVDEFERDAQAIADEQLSDAAALQQQYSEEERRQEMDAEGTAPVESADEVGEARMAPQSDATEIPSEQEDLIASEKEAVNGEDAKIASAIEQAIQEKLREIEGATSSSEQTVPAEPEQYDDGY